MSVLNWSAHPVRFASWLALISASGIVAMLLVEGLWDAPALLLMALPLLLGVYALHRTRAEP